MPSDGSSSRTHARCTGSGSEGRDPPVPAVKSTARIQRSNRPPATRDAGSRHVRSESPTGLLHPITFYYTYPSVSTVSRRDPSTPSTSKRGHSRIASSSSSPSTASKRSPRRRSTRRRRSSEGASELYCRVWRSVGWCATEDATGLSLRTTASPPTPPRRTRVLPRRSMTTTVRSSRWRTSAGSS